MYHMKERETAFADFDGNDCIPTIQTIVTVVIANHMIATLSFQFRHANISSFTS